jgi:hypothetical protein
MKPLDIDGNELRVGDDVEVVIVGIGPSDEQTHAMKIGDRATIDEIPSIEYVQNVCKTNHKGTYDIKKESFVGLSSGWYKLSRQLRLIPRDKKADKNISWKSEVRA